MLPPPPGRGASRALLQMHHVHEGIANVIGDRIFLPSRWQPSNDAKGGHAALRLTGGSHPKPQEAGKSVLSVLSVLSVCPPVRPKSSARSALEV